MLERSHSKITIVGRELNREYLHYAGSATANGRVGRPHARCKQSKLCPFLRNKVHKYHMMALPAQICN